MVEDRFHNVGLGEPEFSDPTGRRPPEIVQHERSNPKLGI